MKLYLDPGHGGTDSGASGNGLLEKDITLDIALKINSILNNDYENIEVKMSRTSDSTKSLSQRTNEANAWGANYYLSIHINAGGGTGYEDYIYSGISDTSTTASYQTIIHAEVLKTNQLRDRGKKKANFHVLRESKMPALLSENGFIDNSQDAALMKQASWRQNVAEGAVHQRSDRRRLDRDQLAEPQRAVCRRVAWAAEAVDDHQRRAGGGRRRLQDDRRR